LSCLFSFWCLINGSLLIKVCSHFPHVSAEEDRVSFCLAVWLNRAADTGVCSEST
jgi:hypothetical protein